MSGTAEVHPEAILSPGKVDLIREWLPKQGWFKGTDASDAERIASFRFVDPFGEVGIETLLIRTQGVTYQVPLTYRSAPLEDTEDYLVGELEHSILGHRWVYDAVGDPVYIDEIIRVIREGDNEADLSTGSPKSMTVEGSGVIPVAASTGQIKLNRIVDPATEKASTRTATGKLEGTWTQDGVERTVNLATLF